MAQDSIVEHFEKMDWDGYLQKMENAKEEEIHYSPSLEIENIENRTGLAISAVGKPGNYEFYIFYKRPKKVKLFFGLMERLNENYLTDSKGQTKNDVMDCLKALLRNDTEYLAKKIGQ